ncbi:MAG: redoxin domain-containing protein [Alphaproteobacteria bacterium]|nr:redoxin domain-containing protein [Alphaproteobacteria bacterium]
MLRPLLTLSTLAAVGAAACSLPAATAPVAEASVTHGKAAPTFTLTGVDGKTYDLAAQKGKVVVLEWYNPDCPFVKYAHGDTGPLHDLGNTWAGKGVVWWAINSGAAGKQGAGQERNQASLGEYGIQYPVLLDADGAVGHLYAAKTTPQVVVIAPDGTVAYQGAVDNAPLGDSGGKPVSRWLDDAVSAVSAGTTPSPSVTQSYGCSVKY